MNTNLSFEIEKIKNNEYIIFILYLIGSITQYHSYFQMALIGNDDEWHNIGYDQLRHSCRY